MSKVTNSQIEAAIREAVFSMTATLSENLRESVANGKLSEVLKNETYDINELRSGFLSETTRSAATAFSKFNAELKRDSSSLVLGERSSNLNSSTSEAANVAAMFKSRPKEAVLDEEAIKAAGLDSQF